MTEQEKRDREITEMIFVIRPEGCNADKCKLYKDCLKCETTRLYDAGYRQEEEVRKETAKEILFRVKIFLEQQTETVKILSKIKSSYAIPQTCVECYEGSQDNRLDELRRIAKEFGVEVEE